MLSIGVSSSPLEIAALALETAFGVAIVCDAKLAIVIATPGCAALLGHELRIGESVVKALCGDGPERPIADALARGIAAKGSIVRLQPMVSPRQARRGSPTVATTIEVSATPLRELRDAIRTVQLLDNTAPEKSARTAKGWLLRLAAGGSEAGSDGADMNELEGNASTADATFFHGIHTREPGMQRVFHIVERAAKRDISVLVRGPSGSGKELVAAAIHQLSPRRNGPFRAINCAAMPADLLESELFGHVKGAFTGAVKDHTGIFRAASGGTLLLDEVAEMPLPLQAKLLRVLETKSVLPVGSTTPIPVDVRIVSATHQSLREAVQRGTFRADLMFRLRVVPIFLPALCERNRDIALLTKIFMQELNHIGLREGTRVVDRISRTAMQRLNRYPWPGNVRELRNALEYAYVIGEGATLIDADLPPELLDEQPANQSLELTTPLAVNAGTANAEASVEVAQIQRALQRSAGNRARAAAMLGMSRITLWRRMTELGIAAPR